MTTTSKFHIPYAQRLVGVSRAAQYAMPKSDEAKVLAAQAAALNAAVRAGADRTTLVLIDRCRATISRMVKVQGDNDGVLVEAVREDGREALNRLANMIRRNDPDPADPKVKVDRG